MSSTFLLKYTQIECLRQKTLNPPSSCYDVMTKMAMKFRTMDEWKLQKKDTKTRMYRKLSPAVKVNSNLKIVIF